jgi:hypothetical protein
MILIRQLGLPTTRRGEREREGARLGLLWYGMGAGEGDDVLYFQANADFLAQCVIMVAGNQRERPTAAG